MEHYYNNYEKQIIYMKKMFYVLLNNGKIKLKRIQELEVNLILLIYFKTFKM